MRQSRLAGPSGHNDPPRVRLKRPRIIGALTAAAALIAAVLTLAAPASADVDGPPVNYVTQLCLQPQDHSTAQGALIVQAPCQYDFFTGLRDNFQFWYYECQNSSCSERWIKNLGSGLCLRARENVSGSPGSSTIMQWSCNSISDVRWNVLGVSSPVSGFLWQSRISGTSTHCLYANTATSSLSLAPCSSSSFPSEVWYDKYFVVT